jgi:hypothetical protein
MEEYLKEKYGEKEHVNIFGKAIPCWKFVLDCYEREESPIYNKKLEMELKKSKCIDKKSYMWLTLSPDKFLRNIDNTPENLNALKTWCSNWFENYLGYGDYSWVVENGSQGDHLHVHAVLEIKNSHKHAERLKRSWARHFPNHQLLTSVDCCSKAYKNGTKKGEYCYMRFDDELILQDKLTYLINEKKGSHENLSDTGVRGSKGFLTDNSLETL